MTDPSDETQTSNMVPSVRGEIVPPEETGPLQIVAMAVQRDADPEALGKLLALQERYDANEARKAYMRDMAAFKVAAPAVLPKDHTVSFPGKGGQVEYKHTRLGTACAALMPLLAQHNLTATWDTNQHDGQVETSCHITHALGHRETVTLSIPYDTTGSKNPGQAVGSAASYGARYTFLLATGMSTMEMDDDGIGSGPRPGVDKPPADDWPPQDAPFDTLPTDPEPEPAQGGDPRCPECGGPMWDNREGKRNPKAPDFKCKKAPKKRGGPGCPGVIWPPDDDDKPKKAAPAKASKAPTECPKCGGKMDKRRDVSMNEDYFVCPACNPLPEEGDGGEEEPGPATTVRDGWHNVKAAMLDRLGECNDVERKRRQAAMLKYYWNRSPSDAKSLSPASLQEMADVIPSLIDCPACGTTARAASGACPHCGGVGYVLAPKVVEALQHVREGG